MCPRVTSSFAKKPCLTSTDTIVWKALRTPEFGGGTPPSLCVTLPAHREVFMRLPWLAACASIALPFCLRLASLLMSGKTTINGATPVCWRKSSALCAISSASGTVPVTSVKSVFIIGIKGLLVAVRGRSISKLSNIMIFFMGGTSVSCVSF